jgi:ribosomal protein S18 acetylase RimI-like enzyme
MTEQISTPENSEKIFNLRQATHEDLEFLFKVSTLAMRPTVLAINPDREFNEQEEKEKYKEKFVPNEIDIIQFEGQDVGRLRVVRSADSIYVGGIQILPEFQGKGIGTAIFKELIRESEQLNVPITLEVHDVNQDAIRFYEKLGFKSKSKEGNQTGMTYTPVS